MFICFICFSLLFSLKLSITPIMLLSIKLSIIWYIYIPKHSVPLSHTLTVPFSHTHSSFFTHTHTLFFSLTHTVPFPHTVPFSHTHSILFSLTHSSFFTHTHGSFHTHVQFLFNTHSSFHTYTLFISLKYSLSHTTYHDIFHSSFTRSSYRTLLIFWIWNWINAKLTIYYMF